MRLKDIRWRHPRVGLLRLPTHWRPTALTARDTTHYADFWGDVEVTWRFHVGALGLSVFMCGVWLYAQRDHDLQFFDPINPGAIRVTKGECVCALTQHRTDGKTQYRMVDRYLADLDQIAIRLGVRNAEPYPVRNFGLQANGLWSVRRVLDGQLLSLEDYAEATRKREVSFAEGNGQLSVRPCPSLEVALRRQESIAWLSHAVWHKLGSLGRRTHMYLQACHESRGKSDGLALSAVSLLFDEGAIAPSRSLLRTFGREHLGGKRNAQAFGRVLSELAMFGQCSWPMSDAGERLR